MPCGSNCQPGSRQVPNSSSYHPDQLSSSKALQQTSALLVRQIPPFWEDSAVSHIPQPSLSRFPIVPRSFHISLFPSWYLSPSIKTTLEPLSSIYPLCLHSGHLAPLGFCRSYSMYWLLGFLIYKMELGMAPTGAGENGSISKVSCLLHKHENLSSDPQFLHKRPGRAAGTHHPACGKWRQLDPWSIVWQPR